ncbi:unnamed protein product [Orchesella dallaii]|uniref:Alpha-amylase n=1 Tax=Orchesella dallaii TaxID=48710 RepID=A0ABP1Q2N4_9HEXA
MAAKIVLALALAFVTLVGAQFEPNFATGRNTITHLFEWRWNDIAEECERFLGPNGYGGVQTSPANENAVIDEPPRPWWERYQPVSYQLKTRSGTEEEFASMVRRCNAVNVRIYVDVVLNHMTDNHRIGVGTGGNTFNAPDKAYPEFSAADFNARSKCSSGSGAIEDWTDTTQVRNCEMLVLRDLDQSQTYVRDHIVEFLNKMVDYGVAGFRIDAVKCMWPAELKEIFDRLNNLPTEQGFAPNSRPFIYQETVDLGPKEQEPIPGDEYFGLGRTTEFRVGRYLGERLRQGWFPLKDLVNWGSDWGMYPDNYAVVFIDNHDNQRGHGGGGDYILTFRRSRPYKMASAFMLAHPYGITRVMSSFNWEEKLDGSGNDENSWVGPPMNANGEIDPVIINPDLTCGNGWICEHRWRSIYNLVKFRNVVAGTSLTDWWDNGNNQIAFCRGNKGFIAINNENFSLNANLQTCLPAGEYCDVYTGDKQGNACTGRSVIVGSDGRADIDITNETEDPVIAIHVEARL